MSHQVVIQKTSECNIFVTIGANFTKIRSRMYLGQETKVKRSIWVRGRGHIRRKHNRRREPVKFHL